MIYFDNAATTKYKPKAVYDAVNYYLREVGVSPGRGSYSLGIDASRMLYHSRCVVGKYFGASRPDRVVFTKNSTEAINLLFNSLLKKGDHVIISCYEHNSVLRPLHTMKNTGIIDYSVIERNDLTLPAEKIYEKYANENTRLFACTLASNLTGRIIYRPDVFQHFHNNGVITFMDSSQGAGKVQINMNDNDIDFLAFTGHKDLLSIPGVGGLCCQSEEKLKPLLQGGTGIMGSDYVNPIVFPEGFEAGTLNMPAIWSLHESIEYIMKNRNEIILKENNLMEYLAERLRKLDNVELYDSNYPRVSTCCINVNGISSDKLVVLLDSAGICVRGGIHCAILAHEAIGTVSTGAVRISLNYKNTKEEIDTFIEVIERIGN